MSIRTPFPRPWLETQDPAGRLFLLNVFEAVNIAMALGDISVEQISTDMHLGIQSFRRRLLKYAGKSPKAFFNAIQMDRAVQLLTDEPEMPVTKIAKKCGFENCSSFGHAFKRTMGCSPSDYRHAAILKKPRKSH